MGLGRNQLAITRLSQESNVVLAGVPVILDDVIQKDRATVVIAQDVLVQSRVWSAGFPITVRCRTLTFADGASIDAEGMASAITFDPGIRQEAAHNPGTPGIDGRDGGRGGDAGTIDIVALEIVGKAIIKANGGAGGRPEDGGHGREGNIGPNGIFVTREKSRDDGSTPGECNGQQGSRGGAAGLPGFRGVGGAGGRVLLRTLYDPAKWDTLFEANGGPAGTAGTPGTPGDGGPPGNAGGVILEECTYDILRDKAALETEFLEQLADSAKAMPTAVLRTDLALASAALSLAIIPLGPNGPGLGHMHRSCREVDRRPGLSMGRGSAGDARLEDVARRQQEPFSSQGTARMEQISPEDFAQCFDGPVVDLLTYATEDSYRQAGNDGTELLHRSINFLLAITTEDPNQSSTKQEAMARAYSMARKQALGLDFFGYTLNRAPLLSFNTYSAIVNSLVLPQGKDIESAFFAYWDAQNNMEAQRSAVRSMQSANQQRVIGIQSEFDRCKKELARQLAELPALDARVATAYQLLWERKAELDQAIRSKHNKCNLVSTLTAVATIVAGVSTGGAGFIAAASAGAKLYGDFTANDDSMRQLWDNRKLIQDDFQELGKGAKTVAEALDTIGDAVGKLTPEQTQMPQFVMERAAFDKVAKDFVNIPEAEAYREAGYDYLKAAETRNQAIVDYNSGVVQMVDLKVKLLSAARTGGTLESNLNSLSDPAEALIVTTMSRLYLDTLSLAAQVVHAEKKALAYHFGRPAQAPLSALNVSALAVTHQRMIIEDWAPAKERYAARRVINPGLFKLSMKRLVSGDAWEAFKRTGSVSLTIRQDHPTYNPLFEVFPGLRVTGLDLRLNGAAMGSDLGYIPWIMTHMGHETIYHGDGTSDVFTHRTVQFSGATLLNGNENVVNPDFSESDLYAGLSPFAAWMLNIRQDPSLKLDLTGLQDVDLVLYGYALDS